jgi:hypothetical protein
MDNNKLASLLVGINQIITYIGVSKPTFYRLAKRGLPANIIDGTWYAHKENIDNYFRIITSKPPQTFPEDEG